MAARPPGIAGPQQGGNTPAVVALCLGIATLIFTAVFAPVGIVLGIAAVYFGAKGRRMANEPATGGGGLALGGLITGGIGLGLSILFSILILVAFITLGSLSASQGDGRQDRQERGR